MRHPLEGDVEQVEDGAQEAAEAAAGVGDVASGGSDLGDDVDVDGDVGDDGQGEVNDGAGNGHKEVEASVELDANDSEDIWDGQYRLGLKTDGSLTSLEHDECLEADLDLGDQGLDADNEVEDDLEVGLNEDIGVEGQAVEGGLAVLECLEVNLEVDEDLEESLGIDVDVHVGNDGGCSS